MAGSLPSQAFRLLRGGALFVFIQRRIALSWRPDDVSPFDAHSMESPAMSSAADRNLLFGILALQMDFINRDQLVAGMNAWVLEKSKPLGQILVEQGALDADNRVW